MNLSRRLKPYRKASYLRGNNVFYTLNHLHLITAYDDFSYYEHQVTMSKFIFNARKRSCGKVMFSVMCVCQSVQGDPHVTITNDALDITVQDPLLWPKSRRHETPPSRPCPPRHGTMGSPHPQSPEHETWDPPGHVPPLVTSSGNHW